MGYECYLLAEHSGGHMEGGSGKEESGVVYLTVSTSRKGVAEKGKMQVPGALGRLLDSQMPYKNTPHRPSRKDIKLRICVVGPQMSASLRQNEGSGMRG